MIGGFCAVSVFFSLVYPEQVRSRLSSKNAKQKLMLNVEDIGRITSLDAPPRPLSLSLSAVVFLSLYQCVQFFPSPSPSFAPSSLTLLSLNSSDVMSIDEIISNELQITPHLLALESFTKTTPASLKSASLASGVVNRFALKQQRHNRKGTRSVHAPDRSIDHISEPKIAEDKQQARLHLPPPQFHHRLPPSLSDSVPLTLRRRGSWRACRPCRGRSASWSR